jgi:hypothetical protein
MFQSSRPVAGARIRACIGTGWIRSSFNPRAPLPGRASVRAQQAEITDISARISRTGARTIFRASIGYPIN